MENPWTGKPIENYGKLWKTMENPSNKEGFYWIWLRGNHGKYK